LGGRNARRAHFLAALTGNVQKCWMTEGAALEGWSVRLPAWGTPRIEGE
jgi:hypothetical protein